MKKNILFIGYGDLGSRLASISKDDLVITGISRSDKPRIIPDQYHSLDWFKNSAQKIDLLENYDCLVCLLYTSPSPRDVEESRMPSSA